jgi:hypothetical protein
MVFRLVGEITAGAAPLFGCREVEDVVVAGDMPYAPSP